MQEKEEWKVVKRGRRGKLRRGPREVTKRGGGGSDKKREEREVTKKGRRGK